jgi:hypothetical protein
MSDTETKEPTKRIPLTVLLKLPKTRAEKRRSKRETAVIVKALLPVEAAFNNAVLSDITEKADSVTYEALYTIFLDSFNRQLRMLEAKDLGIVMPNRRYFADSYSPKISEL